MDYTLRPIRELTSVDSIDGSGFILAEIRDDNNRPLTVNMQVSDAFSTDNIGLDTDGIQIGWEDDLLLSIPGTPDKLDTQTDMNQLLSAVVKDVLTTINTNPEIILSDNVPTKPSFKGTQQYHNEGTIWIDSTTFRSYVMFYDRENSSGPPNCIWIGLTDR